MDPNANLEQQEQLLLALARLPDELSAGRSAAVAQLRELREALSAWLVNGGFAPRWERWPVAAAEYTRRTR